MTQAQRDQGDSDSACCRSAVLAGQGGPGNQPVAAGHAGAADTLSMRCWCREGEQSHDTPFQIEAVREEFNAVGLEADQALQKRLQRLGRDRCTNYRKKVHNLQVELQHNCNGLGLTDPGRELEAIRFRTRMEAVQVPPPPHPTPLPCAHLIIALQLPPAMPTACLVLHVLCCISLAGCTGGSGPGR